jgi:hypothetical protein
MNLINKQREESRFRLGELFLETGIVDLSAVSEGLSIARRTSFPIGRVLVMTGWVSDHDISCALEVQNLLRDGKIDKSLGKDLLRFAHLNKVDINEAFRLNGLTRSGDPSSRLGRLMLAAGVANEEMLSRANREAKRLNHTLGSALVMLRVITPKTLDGALNLQIMLRDRKITFPEAIDFLKEMHQRQVSLREVMGDHGKFLRANKMMPRLGEFLVSADMVNPNHVLIACEIGTEEDNNIGRVLMARGHITESALETALRLQEMIVNRVISYRRAVKLMRLSQQLKAPIDQVLEESQTLDQVFALLRRAGVVPERLVRDVACEIIDFEDTVAEAMLGRGYINPVHARIGLACLERMHRGQITETKAAFVLHHCSTHQGRELEMFSRVNWKELGSVEVHQDLLSQ